MDEVEEGEMVEDKLIIPEEFKNYLNQVADNELGAANTNTTNNLNANVNVNVTSDVATTAAAGTVAPANGTNDDKQTNQPQMLQVRRMNENSENFNQWRNPQAYQMPSPLNQPQSPPLVATPNTPATHNAGDVWPRASYQQAPPPYPSYYNQNGPNTANVTSAHMQCNYNNGYSSTMNYGMVNYGAYH